MKKVISIIALVLVVAGIAFAASGDKLLVTATVPKTEPIYSIEGSLTSDFASSVTGTTSGATITSGVDISSADVTVYIKVTQTNKSVYKDAAGVSLTITPTELINNADATQKTALPSVNNLTAGSGTNIAITATSDNGTKVVTLLSKYANGKPVAADTVIGTFNYKWTHDANLGQGDYTATITMEYTTH